MSWADDKLAGFAAESRFAAELLRRGFEGIKIHNGDHPDFDISAGNLTWEVKADRQYRRTSQVFVETEYDGHPSGLMGTKADYFAIVLGDIAWVYKTRDFREWLEKSKEYHGLTLFEGAGDGAKSKGYLIQLYLLPKIWSGKEWKLL